MPEHTSTLPAPADRLLDEIKAVAKAEVQPVIVDEASGNCMDAPPSLCISGSLGNGWTRSTEGEYFPVRFASKHG